MLKLMMTYLTRAGGLTRGKERGYFLPMPHLLSAAPNSWHFCMLLEPRTKMLFSQETLMAQIVRVIGLKRLNPSWEDSTLCVDKVFLTSTFFNFLSWCCIFIYYSYSNLYWFCVYLYANCICLYPTFTFLFVYIYLWMLYIYLVLPVVTYTYTPGSILPFAMFNCYVQGSLKVVISVYPYW